MPYGPELAWSASYVRAQVLNVCASASRWQHAVGIVEKMIECPCSSDLKCFIYEVLVCEV